MLLSTKRLDWASPASGFAPVGPAVNDVNRKHVIVVGGGFGGLRAARSLRRAPVRVTMIDRRNYHLFQPLLYQVAGAELDPTAIAQPLRGLLARQKNATVLLAEARTVDLATRRVILADGELDYDYLVLASGAMHSYFGHDEWTRHAPGLKSLDDALEIRRRMLLAYEAAERETDPTRRREWLTFVVVGGGATGVELTGTLAEHIAPGLVPKLSPLRYSRGPHFARAAGPAGSYRPSILPSPNMRTKSWRASGPKCSLAPR